MTQHVVTEWQCHPKAERLLLDMLDKACAANPTIEKLRQDLHKLTSTRLFDWVDHITVGASEASEEALASVGFEIEQAGATYRVFRHFGAQLPSVVMDDAPADVTGVAVKAESISDFLMVRGQYAKIHGTPLSGYRRCCVGTEEAVSLWVVERRGSRTMEPSTRSAQHEHRYLHRKEQWQTRPRDIEDEDAAVSAMLELAQAIVDDLGKDMAAWLVLEVERELWQARNRAGHIQKGRQDRVGLGWANHDHHTFRSSRRHFASLIRLFEMLGFHCRERYYAGDEAGWGAQVMENSEAGLVCFMDTDLAPEEVEIDFAHQAIPELEELGTVGLWCELHGDSILAAGMHHLESQFEFDALKEDLQAYDVGMMDPFSSFTYLKQAFTHGEVWPINPRRLHKLRDSGQITEEQSGAFAREGAIGSHMENLQRRDGYKGFNQKNVSYIIKKTDPRAQGVGAK